MLFKVTSEVGYGYLKKKMLKKEEKIKKNEILFKKLTLKYN